MKWSRGVRGEDLLDATDSSVCEFDLDSSRMVVTSEKLRNSALNLSTGSLVCFEHDRDNSAWSDRRELSDRHQLLQDVTKKLLRRCRLHNLREWVASYDVSRRGALNRVEEPDREEKSADNIPLHDVLNSYVRPR